jgi:hypothetical protein
MTYTGLKTGQAVQVDVTGNRLWRWGRIASLTTATVTVRLTGNDGEVTVPIDVDRVRTA